MDLKVSQLTFDELDLLEEAIICSFLSHFF